MIGVENMSIMSSQETEPAAPEPLFRYPFEDLKVNDSFLIACEREDMPVIANRVRSAAIQWGKRHAVRFTTRMVEEGIRVWRIA